MPKQVINVPNAPKMPFSPATRAGDFIFVSGQVGLADPDGKPIEGIEAQTRECLENIRRVLAAAGASLDDVVKVTVFLRDQANFAKMNEAYRSYFPENHPARSTAVTGLGALEMLIEMECIAYCPQS